MIRVRRYGLGIGILLYVILSVLEPIYGEIVTAKFVVEQEGSISGRIEPKELKGGVILINDKEEICWKNHAEIDTATGEFVIGRVKPGVYSLFIALDGKPNMIRAVDTGGLDEIPTMEEENRFFK